MKYSYSERAVHPEPTRTTYQKIVDRRPVDYKQGSELFGKTKRAKKRKMLVFLGVVGVILLFVIFALDAYLLARAPTEASQSMDTSEVLLIAQESMVDLDEQKQRLVNLRMHNILRARTKSLSSSMSLDSTGSQASVTKINGSEDENTVKNKAIKDALVAKWESNF